eukprot:403377436
MADNNRIAAVVNDQERFMTLMNLATPSSKNTQNQNLEVKNNEIQQKTIDHELIDGLRFSGLDQFQQNQVRQNKQKRIQSATRRSQIKKVYQAPVINTIDYNRPQTTKIGNSQGRQGRNRKQSQNLHSQSHQNYPQFKKGQTGAGSGMLYNNNIYFTQNYNSHVTLQSQPVTSTTAVSQQNNEYQNERNAISGMQNLKQNHVSWALDQQNQNVWENQRAGIQSAGALTRKVKNQQNINPMAQSLQQPLNQSSAFSSYPQSNITLNYNSAQNLNQIDESQQQHPHPARKLRVKTAKGARNNYSNFNTIGGKYNQTQKLTIYNEDSSYKPKSLSNTKSQHRYGNSSAGRRQSDSQNKFNFSRTFNQQNQINDDVGSIEPYTAPGDYEIEKITGNRQIVQSNIKSQPKYSFSKSIRTDLDLNRSQIISNLKKLNILAAQTNSQAQLSKNIQSQSFISPGVGDYEVDKELMRQKSPICTIGNGSRFEKASSQQFYKNNLPVGYLSNLDDRQKQKVPMGLMNRTDRFKRLQDQTSPGPGEYNTQVFKSLSKGEFSILTGGYNQTTSPRKKSTLSPFSASMNTLNHTSRLQYEKLFVPENEKALKNQAGPGPSYYRYENANTSFNNADQFRYSIPRTDRKIQLKDWEKKHNKKLPLQYTNDVQNEISLLMKSSQRPVIPQFKKRFDPRKMTGLHESMWRKGITIQ